MGKKIVSLFLVFVFIALTFSCCGRNDDLNIAYPVYENVRTLDPQYNVSSTGNVIIVNCFEGLISIDENGNYIPAAAESWQKDGLTYIFTLRSNAQWKISQTAQEAMSGKIGDNYAPYVTANDFVFAFKRMANPETKAPYAYKFKCIQGFDDALSGRAPVDSIGVRALSDKQLSITLSYDDADFFNKLLLPCAMPCNEQFFYACNGRYGLMSKYLLTNGPFYFTRWNIDSNFGITRNPDYNGSNPAEPYQVWFYLNDDLANMNKKLQRDVYTAGMTNVTNFDTNEMDSDYTATEKQDVTYSLIFNCGKTVPSVKSIRTALISTVNRDFFESENYTMATECLPLNLKSSLPTGVNTVIIPEYNETAAKASLSAGIAELGQDIAEITVLCAPEYENILKNQMQTWQKVLGVSINVKIQAVDETQLLDSVNSGDYEAAFYPIKNDSDFAYDFLGKFVSDSKNTFTKFSSAEYDVLFDNITLAKTDAERADAYNKAIKFLMDNGAWYPIYNKSTFFVCRKDITGIYKYGSDSSIYFARAKKS